MDMNGRSTSSAVAQTVRSRWIGRVRRFHRGQAACVVLVFAVLIVGAAWVVSSPVAGSPDDDYHLGSIWCPRPVASSGCQTRVVDGVTEVMVPEAVGRPVCYAFVFDRSAACRLSLSDDRSSYSRRYDDGNYPTGYYRFHHLLVGHDVERSVLIMRGVNVLIAVALLGAIAYFMPVRLREGVAMALLASWIPMGIYFVASNNPSSWAITGVFAYALGLYASVRSEGGRQWVLLGLGLLGAVLAFASRADSSFYVFVVSLAVLAGVRWRRGLIPHAVVAAAASVVGIINMSGLGQTSALGGARDEGIPWRTRLYRNLMEIPGYFAGFYGQGRGRGMGWLDIPLDGPAAVLAVGLAGAAVFAGARAMSWRRAASMTIMLGAMAGIPVVIGMTGSFRVWEYQSRYVLPLLAVTFLVWLVIDDRRTLLSRGQTVLFVLLSTTVHAIALHTLIQRYVSAIGADPGDRIFSLNARVTWWWSIPISPMGVWLVGVLAYLGAVSTTMCLARRRTDGPGNAIRNPVVPPKAHRETDSTIGVAVSN